MFEWYMTENFSPKVLKIAILTFEFLLYVSRHKSFCVEKFEYGGMAYEISLAFYDLYQTFPAL